MYYNQFVFILEGVGVFAANLILNHSDIIREKLGAHKSNFSNVVKFQRDRRTLIFEPKNGIIINRQVLEKQQEVVLDVT